MRDSLHTIRGVVNWSNAASIPCEDPLRLILDNGNFNVNFKVESWEIFPTQPTSSQHQAFDYDPLVAVLATRENGAICAGAVDHRIAGPMVNDNRQIAWYMMDGQRETIHIDPNHIIVEDLWINAWTIDKDSGIRSLPNQPVGYIITLRQIRTPIFETIMALIKNRAQDDEPGIDA